MIEMMEMPLAIKNLLIFILISILLVTTIFMSGCIEKKTTYGLGGSGVEKRESWQIGG